MDQPVITFEGGMYQPPVLTVPEACLVLRIPKRIAYSKIKAGTFPVRTLWVAGRIKVPTARLMEYLAGDERVSA